MHVADEAADHTRHHSAHHRHISSYACWLLYVLKLMREILNGYKTKMNAFAASRGQIIRLEVHDQASQFPG